MNQFGKGQKILVGEKEFVVEDRLSNGDIQLRDAATKDVVVKPYKELIDYLFAGNLKILDDKKSFRSKKSADILAKDFSQLSEKKRNEAKRKNAYVLAVMDEGLDRKTKKVFEPIIKVISKSLGDENPPSPISLYRWHRNYIKSGENIRSLVPLDENKGFSGSRLDMDVSNFIDSAINKVYLTKQRLPVTEVYDEVLLLINKDNSFRDADNQLVVPDRSTIYRKVKKLNPYDVAKARYGAKYADAKFKQLLAAVKPTRPLERVEIDHTKIDLLVVDTEQGLPIGRPWLTIAIDVYTRCVFGVYLSFEPPSYLSLMQCLHHGIKSKTYIKKLYPEIIHSWDVHGIPELIMVDNGKEFHSTHFVDACLQLGIVIQYAPVKLPWFKGTVERYFGILNKQLLHLQPGTTFSNIFEKGDYDPKKHAVIDLATLGVCRTFPTE